MSFFCRASGNPLPEVHWRRAGKRISTKDDRYMVLAILGGSASVLRIDSANPGLDNGLFECIASNGPADPAVAIAVLEVYPEEQG